MPSPLIDRLTAELGWPRIDDPTALDAFLAEGGEQVLFVTGDPAKNLESTDVAVILPELVQAFQRRFRPAVIGQPVERAVRERCEVWPTPSLIFFRDGVQLGDIAKVRDWDDYILRCRQILDGSALAAE
jgi:hydrogenase-1 operon protein HyaE